MREARTLLPRVFPPDAFWMMALGDVSLVSSKWKVVGGRTYQWSSQLERRESPPQRRRHCRTGVSIRDFECSNSFFSEIDSCEHVSVVIIKIRKLISNPEHTDLLRQLSPSQSVSRRPAKPIWSSSWPSVRFDPGRGRIDRSAGRRRGVYSTREHLHGHGSPARAFRSHERLDCFARQHAHVHLFLKSQRS